VPDSVIRDDSMIGRTYKVPMDAGFGEWFVSETPLLNNLPIKVFCSNQFWGGKTSRNDQRITLARSKSLSAGQDP